jgi:hypothetical protein
MLKLIAALSLAFFPAIQNLDEVIPAVSRNVREFRDFIPNIVCTETMKVGEFGKDGKLVRPRMFESNFAPARVASGRVTFTPTREVLNVDGKPLKKGSKTPEDLVQSTDYPFVPNIVFGLGNVDDHDFKLAGTETLDGVNSLVVEFASKDTQKTLRIVDPIRGNYVLKDSGKAWIDPVAKLVLKLEQHYLNDPDLAREVTMTFGEFLIEGTKHWLPKTIRYSAVERKKTLGFIAEYGDCRMR